MDLYERQRLSADPKTARRMLEAEQRGRRRGRRRIVARFLPADSDTFKAWLRRNGLEDMYRREDGLPSR